jgi:hypothetical protein
MKGEIGRFIGMWIDHEKAYIVSIDNSREHTVYIRSNVEGRFRLSGGSRSSKAYGPQEVASERKIEEKRKHHLQRYYRNVIRAIRDGERILIFGPGEAKIELEREIKKTKDLYSRIDGVEPADKMTERQIVARVREFFALEKPRDSRSRYHSRFLG